MTWESKIEVAVDVELSDVLEFAACALAAIEENDDREAERIIDGFCAALAPAAKRIRAMLRAGELEEGGTGE